MIFLHSSIIQGSRWSTERQIRDFEGAGGSRGARQGQGHVFRQGRWQGRQGWQGWRQVKYSDR